MKISTKGRYALRIMVQMGKKDPTRYVPLRGLAEEQSISEKYLEAIIAPLVKAGFLEGQRGKGGGYRLLRAPEQCTVGEILRTAEGSLAPVACLEGSRNTCPRAGECATLEMWTGLDKLIREYLDGITLEDLIKKDPGNADDYVI